MAKPLDELSKHGLIHQISFKGCQDVQKSAVANSEFQNVLLMQNSSPNFRIIVRSLVKNYGVDDPEDLFVVDPEVLVTFNEKQNLRYEYRPVGSNNNNRKRPKNLDASADRSGNATLR
ncbi:hypothetical protein L6452_17756 [Arctium lappa]|uniref:Uncharacterized protein n=1 Tax=Arctium lappa TaxID=4217 RepID=A0ACB9C454_ARCLA|nr:hypothetical protein L6452_17756 [Arctium lappa]